VEWLVVDLVLVRAAAPARRPVDATLANDPAVARPCRRGAARHRDATRSAAGWPGCRHHV